MSDHFDGKKFFNIDKSANVKKTLWEVLKWLFNRKKAQWPQWIENTHTPQLPKTITADKVFITYVNHATQLIQLQGLTIITDPVFSKRVSPFSWIGPKRVRPPGILLDELPKIDVVLISHNHYDHLDMPSLIALKERFNPLIIVPLGNAKLLHAKNFERVVELDWWQEYPVNPQQKITLVPAQHWSGRKMIDAFRTLWGGYVISSHKLNIYFAGDTGYSSHFTLIAAHFSSIDVSILPIGAYEPRWFMKEQHMNPQEAVQAHLDLDSQLSIGMHFGTFQLTDEGIDDPIEALQQTLQKNNIYTFAFIAPQNGQTIHYEKVN